MNQSIEILLIHTFSQHILILYIVAWKSGLRQFNNISIIRNKCSVLFDISGYCTATNTVTLLLITSTKYSVYRNKPGDCSYLSALSIYRLSMHYQRSVTYQHLKQTGNTGQLYTYTSPLNNLRSGVNISKSIIWKEYEFENLNDIQNWCTNFIFQISTLSNFQITHLSAFGNVIINDAPSSGSKRLTIAPERDWMIFAAGSAPAPRVPFRSKVY